MDSTQAEIFYQGLQGSVVDGWYIDGLLGNGKSAIVLSAKKAGTQAAIKIFHPELVERYGKEVQLERVLREVGLVGAEHPHLVEILGGGECPDTGHLYIVMEHLPYRNLSECLDGVPVTSIPTLISHVASAARFLEDRGLVHRDIKPENIAVSDDYTKAILLDLGVLRPIGLSDLTDVDQRPFIGTLRYSSPEFLLRKEDDTVEGWRALTFYQLGAVLHDLLMRKPIFDEYTSPFARLVEAVERDLPKVVGDDTRLVTLAKHCLVKNPVTRLELVEWSDFFETSSATAKDIAEKRERISKRQKFYRESVSASTAPGVDERWRVKKILEDLSNQFQSRVCIIMNELGCFPLRNTKLEKEPDSKTIEVLVSFERDDEKGLPFRLTVKFEVLLLDENSGEPIYKASSVSALSINKASFSDMVATNSFFTGTISELLDSQVLEEQFIVALENAYEAIEKGVTPLEDKLVVIEQ